MDLLDYPSEASENHSLRSDRMHALIQESPSTYSGCQAGDIPRVIIQYWHDRNAIPEDVDQCIHSWEPLTTKGFRQVLFDDKAARLFIDERLGNSYVGIRSVSSSGYEMRIYFRLLLIMTEGGFYIDADEAYKGGDCEAWFHDDRLKFSRWCDDRATGNMVRAEVFMNKGRRILRTGHFTPITTQLSRLLTTL